MHGKTKNKPEISFQGRIVGSKVGSRWVCGSSSCRRVIGYIFHLLFLDFSRMWDFVPIEVHYKSPSYYGDLIVMEQGIMIEETKYILVFWKYTFWFLFWIKNKRKEIFLGSFIFLCFRRIFKFGLRTVCALEHTLRSTGWRTHPHSHLHRRAQAIKGENYLHAVHTAVH